MTQHELSIRSAVFSDHDGIWQALEPTIRAGESVALDQDTTRASAVDYWFSPRHVVSPAATGRGIAQAMCEHSLERARSRGFLAMQFNFVVGSEERRLKLWQRAGFKVVGTLPKAFRHPSLGLIDAFVLHREL